MKYAILPFILVISSLSWAQSQRLKAAAVAKLFYQAGCHRVQSGPCRGNVTIQVYGNQAQGLPNSVRNVLVVRAVEQAQIWGDTILEGEYTADGNTRLDTVIAIRNNQTVIGYGIRYSEKAWYTGDCSYSSTNPQSLRSCREGRIQEVSFVSTDLMEAEVDQNQFADFTPGR